MTQSAGISAESMTPDSHVCPSARSGALVAWAAPRLRCSSGDVTIRAVRHRLGRLWLAVVAVAVVSACSQHTAETPKPATPIVASHPQAAGSPRAVGFTVGYLPPGFKRGGARQYPPGSSQYVVQAFTTAGPRQRGQLLTVDVRRSGAVGLARYARDNGGLRPVRAGRYRAVMGWNTRKPGDGLHIVYVLVRPGVGFEVMQIVAGRHVRLLDDQTLLRVAASVRVA